MVNWLNVTKNTGVVFIIAIVGFAFVKIFLWLFDLIVESIKKLYLDISFMNNFATDIGVYVTIGIFGIIFLAFGLKMGLWKAIKKVTAKVF